MNVKKIYLGFKHYLFTLGASGVKIYYVILMHSLGARLTRAVRSNSRPAPGLHVLLRLDDETNRLLIKAKDRSLRSKTAEAYMRLRDHLERFPDFYNSETTEEMKKHN